jgi:DNA mismatch repair protein MutS2
LLSIKDTLASARSLFRSFERKESQYPLLYEITKQLEPPVGVIDAISRAISDRGEVLDSASVRLGAIRGEIKVAHERLLSRLEKMVNDTRVSPMLQESIITQRNGRYVIPLRADFKGKLRSIIHDQSSSGATLFVEPLVVVELNNQWHTLQLEERDEERRILTELSELVGQHAWTIIQNVNGLAELDTILACAKYAEDIDAAEPVLAPYQRANRPGHPGSTIRLFQARHPLLDPASVVPIDVLLDENTFVLVITGPNTGGKTVTLKTVGLLVLMAQSGLHIPVQSGSELSVFENVFADIGDEQSIEQSLSTFSGHIKNIVRILRRAGRTTLVLLDELGAGTDPQEGASLAMAILSSLVDRQVPCLVATHYPELKTYAHATAGVVNASMEFSMQTLKPTYHLTIGLPGRSNALAIAERLGLPKEIIQAARSNINPTELRAEDLLDEIHRQREIARRFRSEAEKARNDAQRVRTELNLRLEKIEEERVAILEKARQEANTEVQDLRDELDEVRRGLLRARQPLDALKPLQEQVGDLQEKTQSPVERAESLEVDERTLRLGEKVRVRSLGMEGVVIGLGEVDAEIQISNLRVKARLADLARRGEVDQPIPIPVPQKRQVERALASNTIEEAGPRGATVYYPSPGLELDLRGQRAEDALDALDRYVESAYLAGLPFVRIIHGKGTGKLRQVIRQALGDHPHVRQFEAGKDNEGGEGVTVARLAV